jgi:hypothetical protein
MMNTYRFVVRIRRCRRARCWVAWRRTFIQRNFTSTRTVVVYIQANCRDNAALDVPTAVVDRLGHQVSTRDMLIVEG